MWKKIKDIIGKDVSSDNEVKMYSVIMRIVLIFSFIYSALVIGTTVFARHETYIWVGIAGLIVSMALLYATYNNGTQYAVYAFQVYIVFIMLVNTYFYGTNTAVTQFIYVQITLIFALDYQKQLVHKIVTLLLLLIYRVVLVGYFGKYQAPTYGIRYDSHWQTLHMVICSAMLITIIIRATADFTEMRKKLQKTNIELRSVAGKDPLTGLNNRRSTRVYLENKLKAFQNNELDSITIVMADIDHFKRINDTYGHDNGDIVLTDLANVFGAFMRNKGLASRWGGEEFLLIFINHNGDDTYQLLTKLQHEISKLDYRFGEDEVKITLTFGLSEQGGDEDIDATIKEADEKLYIGKEKGRNIIIY